MDNATTTTIPACPWCRTNRHVQPGQFCKTFYCRACRREFEAVDDGEVGYGNPEKYATRKENYKGKRR